MDVIDLHAYMGHLMLADVYRYRGEDADQYCLILKCTNLFWQCSDLTAFNSWLNMVIL